MTHHDGTDREHDGVDGTPEPKVEEAANFVFPVDHGDGRLEEPVEAEDEGSYVSGAVHEHAPTTDTMPMTMDEKGDYVSPVDHGEGTKIDPDGEAGEYVDAEHGDKK